MKLTLNKNAFVNNLLGPVSKLADNLLLDFEQTESTKVKTLVTSSDNSVILLSELSCEAVDPTRCVVPDCKTFLRLFSGIESETITLDINSNTIQYKHPTFSFKYHLLDESYLVNKKSISEEKINSLTFDTKFVLTKSKLSEIIKFNSIVPDAEKLYFTSEGTRVFAKLGDDNKTNTNEIVTEVSCKFEGQPLNESFPLNIQNVLLFSFGADEIEVSVNHQLKIFKFESSGLKYIASGLVK